MSWAYIAISKPRLGWAASTLMPKCVIISPQAQASSSAFYADHRSWKNIRCHMTHQNSNRSVENRQTLFVYKAKKRNLHHYVGHLLETHTNNYMLASKNQLCLQHRSCPVIQPVIQPSILFIQESLWLASCVLRSCRDHGDTRCLFSVCQGRCWQCDGVPWGGIEWLICQTDGDQALHDTSITCH